MWRRLLLNLEFNLNEGSVRSVLGRTFNLGNEKNGKRKV